MNSKIKLLLLLTAFLLAAILTYMFYPSVQDNNGKSPENGAATTPTDGPELTPFSGNSSIERISPELMEFTKIKKQAEAGDPSSQAVLSEIYRRGEMGVDVDMDNAFHWAKLAAEKKEPIALYNLAFIYRQGYTDARDFSKSHELFNQAFAGLQKLADAGNIRAAYDLGCVYTFGLGTQKNKTEAIRLLKIASEKGFKNAERLIKINESGDFESSDDSDLP